MASPYDEVAERALNGLPTLIERTCVAGERPDFSTSGPASPAVLVLMHGVSQPSDSSTLTQLTRYEDCSERHRMRVVLTKKLAEIIDGIDIRSYRVGDLLDLPANEARLIVAENWAIADRRACIRSQQNDLPEKSCTHLGNEERPERTV
jgi:hypothetical protein